jgi:hypothetical protein
VKVDQDFVLVGKLLAQRNPDYRVVLEPGVLKNIASNSPLFFI